MGYCPVCGRYYLIRTNRTVSRAVLAHGTEAAIEPIDIICPDCPGHDPDE